VRASKYGGPHDLSLPLPIGGGSGEDRPDTHTTPR